MDQAEIQPTSVMAVPVQYRVQPKDNDKDQEIERPKQKARPNSRSRSPPPPPVSASELSSEDYEALSQLQDSLRDTPLIGLNKAPRDRRRVNSTCRGSRTRTRPPRATGRSPSPEDRSGSRKRSRESDETDQDTHTRYHSGQDMEDLIGKIRELQTTASAPKVDPFVCPPSCLLRPLPPRPVRPSQSAASPRAETVSSS
jgi:hypothetical protein